MTVEEFLMSQLRICGDCGIRISKLKFPGKLSQSLLTLLTTPIMLDVPLEANPYESGQGNIKQSYTGNMLIM